MGRGERGSWRSADRRRAAGRQQRARAARRELEIHGWRYSDGREGPSTRGKAGLALVFITHNLGLVRSVADRVLVLKDGRLREEGRAARVIDAPSDDYTRELIAAASEIISEPIG